MGFEQTGLLTDLSHELRKAVYLLFLFSPVKPASPVADQFLQVRKIVPVISSGIDYFVGPVDVFEAALEVVEYVLSYVDFERPNFYLYPRREE